MIELKKQEVKIECNNNEFFFFQHSFKTALEHANDFVERNKGKFKMKLFVLNESSFGERWILREVYKKEEHVMINIQELLNKGKLPTVEDLKDLSMQDPIVNKCLSLASFENVGMEQALITAVFALYERMKYYEEELMKKIQNAPRPTMMLEDK